MLESDFGHADIQLVLAWSSTRCLPVFVDIISLRFSLHLSLVLSSTRRAYKVSHHLEFARLRIRTDCNRNRA